MAELVVIDIKHTNVVHFQCQELLPFEQQMILNKHYKNNVKNCKLLKDKNCVGFLDIFQNSKKFKLNTEKFQLERDFRPVNNQIFKMKLHKIETKILLQDKRSNCHKTFKSSQAYPVNLSNNFLNLKIPSQKFVLVFS